DRGDHLSLDRRDQPATLQLVRAELVQRRRGHVGMDADPHGDTGVVAAPDLVEHDGGVAPVEPRAAPLRIGAQAEHAELAHLPVERLVEPALAIELARARDELVLDELPHRRAEQLVLGAAIEIIAHGADLTVPSGGLPAPPLSFRVPRRWDRS